MTVKQRVEIFAVAVIQLKRCIACILSFCVAFRMTVAVVDIEIVLRISHLGI